MRCHPRGVAPRVAHRRRLDRPAGFAAASHGAIRRRQENQCLTARNGHAPASYLVEVKGWVRVMVRVRTRG